MRYVLFILLLVSNTIGYCQSNQYSEIKETSIEKGSVFTKIINRELPAIIVFEDEDIISFIPLHPQAAVHFLIVPKKEIHTLNDMTNEDTLLLGKMFLVAKRLALEYGISESGYRVTINTNEDAGQSVFHLHMHLMGGKELGPMVKQQ
jgi:histidine triad (HIT) family protein